MIFASGGLDEIFQEIKDIMIVSVVTEDLPGLSNSIRDRIPKLLPLVLRKMLDEVFPITNLSSHEVLKMPMIPQSPLSNSEWTGEVLYNILGKGRIKLPIYMNAFFKNLFRYAYGSSTTPLEIHLRVIYQIVRQLGWQEAVQYWERLWNNMWIHNSIMYSHLWTTLNLYDAQDDPGLTSLSFEDFRNKLLNRDILGKISQSAKELLITKMNALLSSANSRISKQRKNSITMSEWLRALFEIYPDYLHIEDLSTNLISMNQDELKEDLFKIRRYSAENRVDIATAIDSPLHILPQTFSDPEPSVKGIEQGKRYFSFYYKGRVTIPGIIYESFVDLLDKYWPRMNSFKFFSALREIIRNDLNGAFLKAYESLYPVRDEIIKREYNLREKLQNDDEYLELGQFGRPIARHLIHASTLIESGLIEVQEYSVVLMVPDFPVTLRFLQNHLHSISVSSSENSMNFNQSPKKPGNHDENADVSSWITIANDILTALSLIAKDNIGISHLSVIRISLPYSEWNVTLEIKQNKLSGLGLNLKKIEIFNTTNSLSPGTIATIKKTVMCLKLLSENMGIDTSTLRVYLPPK